MKKRIISLVLLCALLAPQLCVLGCSGGNTAVTTAAQTEAPQPTPTPTPTPTVEQEGKYMKLGKLALEDMMRNYWDSKNNHIYVMRGSRPAPGETRQETVWDHTMVIIPMYTMWKATGDEAIRKNIESEWKFLKKNFTFKQISGRFGNAPNIAVDDSSWCAYTYLLIYHATKDQYALDVLKELIGGTFEFYKDGDTENGLWYPQNPPSNGNTDKAYRWKSIYCSLLLLVALEYMEITGEDIFMEDTLNVYNWIEEHMLRDKPKTYVNGLADGGTFTDPTSDMLYYCDYNDGRTGRTEANAPDAATRPNDIKEAGSVSHLAGNMTMAIVHLKLWKATQEQKYLDRAVQTVRAINDSTLYSIAKGVYVNDRDCGTTATVMVHWVEEILMLDAFDEYDYNRVFKTVDSISEHCRTEEGYYLPNWSGADAWLDWMERNEHSEKVSTTTGNTVCMVTAAALLEKLLSEKE